MPSSRARRLAAGVALVAIALAAFGGCVFRQRREMVESREAYQECVRENPEAHREKCAELEAEAISRQERYQNDAQRAWGCAGPGGTACDPRDRTPELR